VVTRWLLAGTAAALVAMLLHAPAATGDERSERRARRVEALRAELRSGDPSAVARAAFAAGGLYRSRSDLVPSLLHALQRITGSETPDDARVVKHLLDALIRLDARVATSLLEAHELPVTTSTEALILAVRNGEPAYPLLRRTVERSVHGPEIEIAGVAAGNLLAAAGDRHLLALMLPYVRPRIDVTVFDHHRARGETVGSPLVTGCAWSETPEDHPPAVWYELSFHGCDWQPSLLARGAVESVWWVRREERRGESFACLSTRRRDATGVGLGWVATLLGVGIEELPLKPSYRETRRWRGPGTYTAFVQDVHAGVLRDGEALLDRLLGAGLLTPEDRRILILEPRFVIEDARYDRTDPLPPIPGTR
jgi:hypothetical protein